MILVNGALDERRILNDPFISQQMRGVFNSTFYLFLYSFSAYDMKIDKISSESFGRNRPSKIIVVISAKIREGRLLDRLGPLEWDD